MFTKRNSLKSRDTQQSWKISEQFPPITEDGTIWLRESTRFYASEYRRDPWLTFYRWHGLLIWQTHRISRKPRFLRRKPASGSQFQGNLSYITSRWVTYGEFWSGIRNTNFGCLGITIATFLSTLFSGITFDWLRRLRTLCCTVDVSPPCFTAANCRNLACTWAWNSKTAFVSSISFGYKQGCGSG